jgi:DNA-binding transcriptional ArsR family regulator
MEPAVDIDVARLRSVLAVHRIRHDHFAREARIARAYFSIVLHGHKRPGELTRLRIAHALAQHGISVEEVSCAAS